MRVCFCSDQQILSPCSLEGHNYQVDPYIGCEHHCHYCYALGQAKTDWKEEILIYRDLAGQLDHELSALEAQNIYMGWNSDPYQPAEADHYQTRKALGLLAQRGFSVCILTKSDLVVRDIDLLARMPGSSVGFSIAFQDEDIRRLFEEKAPANERRINALKKLKEAGIRTYVLICPVMPFITDVEALAAQVAPYADASWVYALSMKAEGDQNWRNVREILSAHFPKLIGRYRQIAFSADHPYWRQLRQRLSEFQKLKQLNLRIEL